MKRKLWIIHCQLLKLVFGTNSIKTRRFGMKLKKMSKGQEQKWDISVKPWIQVGILLLKIKQDLKNKQIQKEQI